MLPRLAESVQCPTRGGAQRATALFMLAVQLGRRLHWPNVFAWQDLSRQRLWLGAALGSYSHIVLDSFMHADMHPLAPFSGANPLLHAVSLASLFLGCIGAGLLSVVVLIVRTIRSEPTGTAKVTRGKQSG